MEGTYSQLLPRTAWSGTNFTLEWERFKEEQKAVLRAMKLPGKLKQVGRCFSWGGY